MLSWVACWFLGRVSAVLVEEAVDCWVVGNAGNGTRSPLEIYTLGWLRGRLMRPACCGWGPVKARVAVQNKISSMKLFLSSWTVFYYYYFAFSHYSHITSSLPFRNGLYGKIRASFVFFLKLLSAYLWQLTCFPRPVCDLKSISLCAHIYVLLLFDYSLNMYIL